MHVAFSRLCTLDINNQKALIGIPLNEMFPSHLLVRKRIVLLFNFILLAKLSYKITSTPMTTQKERGTRKVHKNILNK